MLLYLETKVKAFKEIVDKVHKAIQDIHVLNLIDCEFDLNVEFDRLRV